MPPVTDRRIRIPSILKGSSARLGNRLGAFIPALLVWLENIEIEEKV